MKRLYKKYEEIIKYLIIGGLTTLVSIVSYSIFRLVLNWSLVSSEVLSWLLAVLFAYITNKNIVFKSKNKNVLKESVFFFVFRIVTLFIGIYVLIFLEWLMPSTDLWITASKVIQQAVIFVLNYIFSKFFIFKQK